MNTVGCHRSRIMQDTVALHAPDLYLHDRIDLHGHNTMLMVTLIGLVSGNESLSCILAYDYVYIKKAVLKEYV